MPVSELSFIYFHLSFGRSMTLVYFLCKVLFLIFSWIKFISFSSHSSLYNMYNYSYSLHLPCSDSGMQCIASQMQNRPLFFSLSLTHTHTHTHTHLLVRSARYPFTVDQVLWRLWPVCPSSHKQIMIVHIINQWRCSCCTLSHRLLVSRIIPIGIFNKHFEGKKPVEYREVLDLLEMKHVGIIS